jgi:hypothetical protein
MPLAVAEYLRHLAMRCSRMSRDCTDKAIDEELVQMSVELVEKAELLESYFSIAERATGPDDILTTEIIRTDEDDKN